MSNRFAMLALAGLLLCSLLVVACKDGSDPPGLGDKCEYVPDGGWPCDVDLVCSFGVCVEAGDENHCALDSDCPGAQLCTPEHECLVVCLAGAHNEDCDSNSKFVTLAYGECEEVPCTKNSDCEGLEDCDDPELDSPATFACNADSVCERVGQ